MKSQVTKSIYGVRNQETFALDEKFELQSGKSKLMMFRCINLSKAIKLKA